MTTLELLDRAGALPMSEADLCRTLGLSRGALSAARGRGRLSPAVAATLAAELGDDPAHWTLVAVRENERSAPMRRKLDAIIQRAMS